MRRVIRNYLPSRLAQFSSTHLRSILTKSVLLFVIISMLSAPFADAVHAAPALPIQKNKPSPESDLVLGPLPIRTTPTEIDLRASEEANAIDGDKNTWDTSAVISNASAGGSRDDLLNIPSAAPPQSQMPSGGMIFVGPFVTHREPIPATPGHRYAMHVAFEQPGCGNCNASAFIGPEPFVWPNNIYGMCWTGYGGAQECVTETFLNSSNSLHFEIWITVPYIPPDAGIVRIFDLDLPPGVYDLSTSSSCQPKDGTGDERECQVNGTKDTQGYAGDPINTRTGTFDMVMSDLTMNTAAGPLLFQRTYSSATTDLLNSDLGPGWTHNHDTHLIFPNDPGGEENAVWFKAHTSNLYRFLMVGNGSFQAYPGVLATLVKNNGPPLTYTLTSRAQDTYTFDSDGVLLKWSNAVGNSFQYAYDAQGRLDKVQDDTGSRFLVFGYDAQDRIVTVDDHAGRNLTFTFDGNGDQATIQNPLGDVWTYSYDAEHRLTQITDPNGLNELRVEYAGQGRAVRQYNGLDELVVEIDYSVADTTTFTDALGNTTTHVYDADSGVLEQEIDALNGITTRTYDSNLRLETLTVPLGNISSLEWSDDGHNLERTVDPAGFETVMDYNAANRLEMVRDALANETHFEYTGALLDQVTDALNNVTAFNYTTAADAPQPPGMLKSIQDALLRETTYEYDAAGDRIKMVDALNQSWKFKYTSLGWLQEATDPRSVTTRYEYDNLGRVIEIMRNYEPLRSKNEENLYNIVSVFVYDDVGRLTDLVDTLQRVTHFEYDDADRIVALIENYKPGFGADQATNVETQFIYNAAGNQIAVLDPLGRITRTYFDALDRPVRMVQNLTAWDISNTNPPPFDPAHPDENVPTQFDYDANGNLIEAEDALGAAVHICYDPRGLATKSILNPMVADPCTSYSLSANPALDIIQSQTYDAVGNMLSSTNAIGETSNYAYDDVKRLLSISNPLNFVNAFGYDAVGNQTSMTDAEGIVTHYEYDPLNRQDAVVENFIAAGPVDYETNVRTTYAYDPVGNLKRIIDAAGSSWSTTYNGLDQVIGEDDPLGNTWEYDYSPIGLLDSRTDPKGFTTGYGYDALNRLLTIDHPSPDPDVSMVYDALGNAQSMLDGLGTTSWSYDGFNRPLTVNDPFSEIVAYTYDAVGNRTGITYPDGKTASYDYDSAYRLTQVEDWDSSLTTYSYDKAGRPLSAVLPNGITSNFDWDSAGRLSALTHNANGFDLASYAYRYDKLGNRMQAVEYVHQPLKPPAGPHTIYLPTISGVGTGTRDTIIDYEYDPLYRLTKADYNSGEYFHYGYDAVGNRLTQDSHLDSNAYQYDAAHRLIDVDGVTYTWDDNGNLIDDGERTFTYDHADRLTAVGDQQSAFSFTFDGLGNRYQQTIDNSTTTYSLDLAAGLTQVLGDGSSSYLYGLGRIGEDDGVAWQFPLSDALGSVRQLTSSATRVSLAQNFEPFGSPMATAGEASSDFGFTGEQNAAGLVYLRARFYDPRVGRFLTKDPVQGFLSLPSTLNPYVYGLNNPATLLDPSGENPVPLLVLAAVTFIGGFAVNTWNQYQNNNGWCGYDLLAALHSGLSTAVTASLLAMTILFGWSLAGMGIQGIGVLLGHASILGLGLSVSTAGTAAFLWFMTGQRHWLDVFRAQSARNNLGNFPSTKTAAASNQGTRALSGWKSHEGFTQATDDVLAQAEIIGYDLPASGPLDQGILGQYAASHAEKQMAMIAPNQPIAVSTSMCSSCIDFFQAIAQYSGQAQVVADPSFVRIFLPNGGIVLLP